MIGRTCPTWETDRPHFSVRHPWMSDTLAHYLWNLTLSDTALQAGRLIRDRPFADG
jgi:hypothetical protein